MEDLEHGIISAVGNAWLGALITAAVIIAITAVVGHLLTKFLRRVLNYSDELPSSSIFINIGRAIVWVVGGSVVLSTCFGVDVSAAIAALGIGGIAISLGFRTPSPTSSAACRSACCASSRRATTSRSAALRAL